MNFSQKEIEIIKLWKEKGIFKKSLQKKGNNFVFYEGPPTANAKPGVHHVLARAFKDIICRYKTMRGFKVLRKAGWDIHGLPVELSVEKELGLGSKKEIEEYGIDKFNQKCQQSVWKYAQEWADLTERIGYWLDLDNPYITGDAFYMESVFNIIKKIWDKGLLEQGYKVVPYCPRCGTGLSSHEVAQGYEKIKEPAIYVKFGLKKGFKFQVSGFKTYLLVWTTTPWTLPANVAVAVNPNIKYILVKKDGEFLILARERQDVLGGGYEIISELDGKELVGLNYEPLFDQAEVSLPEYQNIYRILAADFVTTEEGTGLVHVAPAFGQEDMELIKMENEKLNLPAMLHIAMQAGMENEKFPIILTVDEEGKFKSEVKKWAGMFVKNADPLIIQHLQKKGKLFKIEDYEHDYPFCWRCNTPLLYYAKKSWFIKTTQVKQKLIANNQKINWIPVHIKEGRFGEWLNDLKDWALSRERYWGTPLPVWHCQNCHYQEVIGSREDLRKQKFSTNKYLLLRHGESVPNVEGLYCSWPEPKQGPLTEKGTKEIEKSIPELKKNRIDLIFSSDILRTSQTAEIISQALKIKVEHDKRLRELSTGTLNGKNIQEGDAYFNPEGRLNEDEVIFKKFTQSFPEGENYFQAGIRMLDFIRETEKKYKDKNILIVSHEVPLMMLRFLVEGWQGEEAVAHKKEFSIQTGELKELEYKAFPYNQEGKLDFHRPYIDEIEFICPKCKGLMKRVPEVIDCWFDSGAMPFAQAHWPFDTKGLLFPADYICEGIDQTRGWFYTLLAVSTLLGFESPYKNVIVLGHVLDEKGQKMSKSKGNVVDPWLMAEKYGADALRWYLFTVNQPGDPKLFSEKDIDQGLKKFILTFWNCYVFLKTYSSNVPSSKFQVPSSKNLLDKWILSRLNNLILKTTEKLDNYDITSAARLLEDFVINDLSLWYIRRSRQRFQRPADVKESTEAFSILYQTISVLSKLTAPFVPFVSETIHRDLVIDNSKESVHLEDWPRPDKKNINKKLEQEMETIRKIVGLGLKLRSDAQIKTRQPLRKLKVKSPKLKVEEGLLDLIKEELNVKEVEVVPEIQEEENWTIEQGEGLTVALNKEITKELQEEGKIRELVRQIQEMRKQAGCKPEDKITVYYFGDEMLIDFLADKRENILSQIKAKDFILQKDLKPETEIQKEIQIEGKNLWLGIKIVVR